LRNPVGWPVAGQEERATRRVREVVVRAGRVVDAVPAAADRPALQAEQLR